MFAPAPSRRWWQVVLVDVFALAPRWRRCVWGAATGVHSLERLQGDRLCFSPKVGTYVHVGLAFLVRQ
jgi:hypothetical protein